MHNQSPPSIVHARSADSLNVPVHGLRPTMSEPTHYQEPLSPDVGASSFCLENIVREDRTVLWVGDE